MKNLYHRLLLLIAGSTQKELAAHIRYLKIENEILRSKLPKRVSVTEKERNKLVKFGSKLGKVLGELVTIVHPDTLRRWIREATTKGNRKPAKKGRPRTQEAIRELIIKLARENEWGYTRIMGELKKLGIKPPSRNTVKNSRLTTLTHVNSGGANLARFTYAYDKVGNRTECTELNGDIVTWTYDNIYQLEREKRNGANSYDITHTYDGVGNRLTKVASGTVTTFSYDVASQLSTSTTGATTTMYSYDNKGNLEVETVGGTRTTYTWDEENRLTQVARTNGT